MNRGHGHRNRLYPLLVCALMPVWFASAASAAPSAGTTAFSFVRIIPDARRAALGGAFVPVGGDVNALAGNPAGLARLRTPQVSLTYTNYFLDIQYGLICYAHPLGARQTVGVGIQYLSFGTFRETTPDDPSGSALGTFEANDLALVLSYSRLLGSWFAFGITLKSLYERIHTASMDAVALDAGVQVHLPARRLSGGVALQHAGAVRNGLAGRRDPLPVGIRAGVGYMPQHLPVFLVAEIEKSRGQPLAGRLGGEFSLRDRLFLRGGYASAGADLRLERSDTRLMGFAGGLGVQANAFRLDYAVTPALRLGTVHRISLTCRFE
jgi:hypothetical protein